MEEDIKVIETYIKEREYKLKTRQEILFKQAIENLIKEYKELEEYQHKVNQILNLDDDNLDIVLVDNCQKGLKKCVTEFEKENQSYRDYFGTPPCYDNADYILKSKVREKIEKIEKQGIWIDEDYYYNEELGEEYPICKKDFTKEELEEVVIDILKELQEGDK